MIMSNMIIKMPSVTQVLLCQLLQFPHFFSTFHIGLSAFLFGTSFFLSLPVIVVIQINITIYIKLHLTVKLLHLYIIVNNKLCIITANIIAIRLSQVVSSTQGLSFSNTIVVALLPMEVSLFCYTVWYSNAVSFSWLFEITCSNQHFKLHVALSVLPVFSIMYNVLFLLFNVCILVDLFFLMVLPINCFNYSLRRRPISIYSYLCSSLFHPAQFYFN